MTKTIKQIIDEYCPSLDDDAKEELVNVIEDKLLEDAQRRFTDMDAE